MKGELSDVLDVLPHSEIKLEVLLAELLEMGYVEMDELNLRPLGLFKRAYRLEILQAILETSHRETKLRVDTCREGLYDILPKTLFHGAIQHEPFEPVEKMLEDLDTNKKIESSARQFFHPLDQEFIRKRIEVELGERQLLGGFSNVIQRELFSQMLGEVVFLSDYQQQLLYFLLPLAHKITGDIELTQLCFEIILGNKINIQPLANTTDIISEQGDYDTLGANQLGVNFLLGGEVLNDLNHFSISVENIANDQMIDYLPGGKGIERLHFLAEFFLPIEWEVSYEFNFKAAYEAFKLGGTLEDALLGLSTRI